MLLIKLFKYKQLFFFQIKMSIITTSDGKIVLFSKDEIVTFNGFDLEKVDKFVPDIKIENSGTNFCDRLSIFNF